MINFERYKAISESIDSFLRYAKKGYEHLQRFTEAGSLAYLEEHLARIQLGRATDDSFDARSLELQRQEALDYDHRLNELHSVGFRTSPTKKR